MIVGKGKNANKTLKDKKPRVLGGWLMVGNRESTTVMENELRLVMGNIRLCTINVSIAS